MGWKTPDYTVVDQKFITRAEARERQAPSEPWVLQAIVIGLCLGAIILLALGWLP